MAVAVQAGATAQRVEEVAKTFSSRSGCPVLVVTVLDLLPLIQNLGLVCSSVAPAKLANFLGTNFARSPYDFPKLVEAFIRLRNLGGCPVLRIDQDVLFNTTKYPKTDVTPPLRLAEPIRAMVSEYYRQSSLGDSPVFLITGRYLNSTAGTVENWSPDDWLGAFATRPFPALAEDSAMQPIFHAKTLLAYYGVNDTVSLIEACEDGLPAGISRIGAPPLNSPISGSLLTFNEPLVMNVPPFCNYRLNVVWIDDFLKFALHRDQFRLSNNEVSPDFLTAPLIGSCQTVKQRPTINNARAYTLDTYLPALVRGCVVDAWIQPDARTKLDFSAAAEPGPLIRHLQAARQSGALSAEQASSCRADLLQSSLVRLGEVKELWERLPPVDGIDSLGAEWVGRGPLSSQIALETLIEDTLEYIEWAVAWPTVANAVRAYPRGALKFDLP